MPPHSGPISPSGGDGRRQSRRGSSIRASRRSPVGGLSLGWGRMQIEKRSGGKMTRFGFLLLIAVAAHGAEPDWTKVEPHALDLLQRYIQIESVNPPADTRKTAALIQAELETAGLT